MGRFVILFVFLFSIIAAAETMPAGSIQILSSPDVASPATRARAEMALALVRGRLDRHDQPIPNILVLYATEAAASTEGLPAGRGIIVARLNGDVPLYHLWIIGTHEEEKLVYGLISILNSEWHLALTPQQIEAHRQHICRNLSSTVPVSSLVRP
jgi:hypothetical protein